MADFEGLRARPLRETASDVAQKIYPVYDGCFHFIFVIDCGLLVVCIQRFLIDASSQQSSCAADLFYL